MTVYITLKLFAALSRFQPEAADNYPIESETTIKDLIKKVSVPERDVKLIFIDGVKGDLTSTLTGGERVEFSLP